MILRCLLAALALRTAFAGSVSECRKMTTCEECADSYIHVFGFKEYCRWCVDTSSCGGPISCPLGQPVVLREPFKCPAKMKQVKGHRYTDALGRSLFAMALASKDDNITECLQNSRPDVTLVKRHLVECDSAGNTCSGYLAVSDEAKAIYVVYRGTTLDKQLFTEFIHGLAAQLGAWEKFEAGGGVITYFHQGFTRLFKEDGMKDELEDLKKKYPNYRVWVTGHSMGGSLASMTALYLVKSGMFDEKKVRLVTFGEPRTGNVAYAKAIESALTFRFRVVHRNDFVTNIPGSLDPNAIMIANSLFERQPLFYRYLVHYDNDMKKNDRYHICELSDDHGCRNLALAADVNDHVTYFGINADEYGKQRCKRSLLALD